MNVKGSPLAWTPLMILLAACGGGGGARSAAPKAAPGLDTVAEAYVKPGLAVGRHDDRYVDAYYGPPAWKTVAGGGQPVPLPDLLAQARTLQADLRAAEGPQDRKRFLEKQLVAVEGH